MRTSLPVSTISYNTPAFLANALAQMVANGEVSFWAFILHKGEGGDKDHVHLYVEPSRLRTQDDWKQQYFLEFDPEKPDKPRSVTSWRKSKWKDWYLYGLHDQIYLMTKGERKQFAYLKSDFVVSDEDIFNEYVADCDVPVGDSTFLAIRTCCEAGMSWIDIVRTGLIPTRNLNVAEKLYVLLSYSMASSEVGDAEDGDFPVLNDLQEQSFCDGLFL